MTNIDLSTLEELRASAIWTAADALAERTFGAVLLSCLAQRKTLADAKEELESLLADRQRLLRMNNDEYPAGATESELASIKDDYIPELLRGYLEMLGDISAARQLTHSEIWSTIVDHRKTRALPPSTDRMTVDNVDETQKDERMPAEAILYRAMHSEGLEKMLAAQDKGLELYGQPNGKEPIPRLRDDPPTPERPITIYFSTGDDRSTVSYVADLVSWRDKRELGNEEKQRVCEEIIKVGFNVEGLFHLDEMVNLLQFRNLIKLARPFSVGELILVSKGRPHSTNVLWSGFSYVYEKRNLKP